MPKVSIIVPIHNPGKYLIPMLNSLIYQTFRDIEILLIDDGSTDGSREIIKQFETMDKRITVVFREKKSNERFSQKYSADLGRKMAKGEYIMIIDHDDELILNAIETLYAYTNNGSIDVIQGRYKQIDEMNNVIYKTPNIWPQPTLISNLNELPEDILLLHLAYAPVALWACLIRNDFQKDLELTDCVFNDTNFIWELKINAKTFYYIPDEVYIYRLHHDSTSSGINANKVISDIFLVFEYLETFLKQQNISEKLWKIYYVYKFYTLHKMHAGLSIPVRLDYFKRISKIVQSDLDISHLLMLRPVGQDLLINYLLLRQYKE